MLRGTFATLCQLGLRSGILLLAGCILARAADEPPTSALAEALKLARVLVAKDATKVPGLAITVAHEGKVVWSEGFGYADLETKRPVSPATTRFRIASVSKPLTAAGLMRLVERGKLDLDAPVQNYVPDFPGKKEGVITARLLAGHLAGIRHYKWLEPFMNKPFATTQAGLAIFKDDPLVAAPGAEFHYSTYGYSLLSAAIESAAQRDFLDYMQAEVFAPLGMKHTRPDRAGAVDPDRTQFYKGSLLGGPRLEEPIDSSYKWAGGGFLSTAEDLAAFGSALLQPGFLMEESLATMFTPQKPRGGKASSYGIGWGIVSNWRGRTYYLHSGDQQGASTILFILPKAKIAIAILTNLSKASLLSRDDPVFLVKCFDGLAPPAQKTP